MKNSYMGVTFWNMLFNLYVYTCIKTFSILMQARNVGKDATLLQFVIILSCPSNKNICILQLTYLDTIYIFFASVPYSHKFIRANRSNNHMKIKNLTTKINNFFALMTFII